MKFVNLYTDGGCSGNQSEINVGGWGAILEYGETQKEIFGGEVNTTNNRMELFALISALEALNKDSLNVRVFSDSSYVINCFKAKWYEAWLKNGWKNSSKKEVENRDLWERLLALTEKHQISFYHVKGHVNLNSKNLNLPNLYKKFKESNGDGFSQEEFVHITEMNNRADLLANKGIDANRPITD